MTGKINMKRALIGLMGLWMAASAFSDRPNVLFLVLDDMNNDLVFLNGEPKALTPNLDRLAEQSTVFEHAYCAAPACVPTRAAVLSGLRPSTTGLYENWDNLQSSEPLLSSLYLPEHFRKNGYFTMWAGKVFHQRPGKEKLARMWSDQHFKDGGYGPKVQKGKGELPVPLWGNAQKWAGPDSDFPDVRNTDAVIAKLNEDMEKPFFIALGLYRPHVPYTAPKRFFDLYDRSEIKLPPLPEDDLDDLPPSALAMVTSKEAHHDDALTAIRNGYLKTILHGYLASVSFADWNVGRVLEALDRSAYAENTIVVLWGDHGFHHGEKQRFTKFALWEKTTNMPMLFRLPGKQKGQRSSSPVSQMDLYPTLCELCGLEVPGHVEGKSIVPILHDPEINLGPALTTQGRSNHALRTVDYRYIRYANGDEEFYVHADDPHEWNNQADNPEYVETIRQLRTQLPTVNVPPARTGKNKRNKVK